MSDKESGNKRTHRLEHLDRRPNEGSARRLRDSVESVTGGGFTEGNEVEVLRNGDEIFPTMLDAISKAEESIDLVTFVYWTGQVAEKLANLLAERSRAGVRVRVVLDAFGSSPMKTNLIDEMTGAGVAVERFRPITRWKFWEADHRTHRKILIIDHQVAFTGGVGIAEEWEGDARGPDEWRETHFKITGPAVLALKATFLADWRDTGHRIDASDVGERDVPKNGDSLVAVVDASANIGFNAAQRVLETLVIAAEQRILIQTPYFNPAPDLIELLQEAVRRGVEVDIMVPGPNIDKRVSAVVAEEMYEPLLDFGVRVWLYQPTMLHTKTFLVDGVLSFVGSVNINRRSVEKDEEAAVAILDAGITRILEDHFRDDVKVSEPATIGEAGRPIQRKLAAKILRPIRKEF